MIKQQELEAGFVPRPKRPRALILGPTKELAEQIAGRDRRDFLRSGQDRDGGIWGKVLLDTGEALNL